jgi:hypothetical protein
LLLASVFAAASSFGQVVGERPLSTPVYRPVDRFVALSIASDVVTPNAKLIVTGPGKVIAAYSIVAPDAIFGAVERVFINAPHAIRERALELRSNP